MDKRTRQTQIMGKNLDPRRGNSVAGHLVREQARHGMYLYTCSCVYVCMCVYRMFLYSEKALSYILPEDPLCGESRGSLVIVCSPGSEQHRTSFLAYGLIYSQSSLGIQEQQARFCSPACMRNELNPENPFDSPDVVQSGLQTHAATSLLLAPCIPAHFELRTSLSVQKRVLFLSREEAKVYLWSKS